MKQKIRILNGDETKYFGKVIELPAKESSIIEKSIELFDDEDPCIIHQSYVQKEFADTILKLLKKNNNIFHCKDYVDELYFLNLTNLENLTIKLEV